MQHTVTLELGWAGWAGWQAVQGGTIMTVGQDSQVVWLARVAGSIFGGPWIFAVKDFLAWT